MSDRVVDARAVPLDREVSNRRYDLGSGRILYDAVDRGDRAEDEDEADVSPELGCVSNNRQRHQTGYAPPGGAGVDSDGDVSACGLFLKTLALMMPTS